MFKIKCGINKSGIAIISIQLNLYKQHNCNIILLDLYNYADITFIHQCPSSVSIFFKIVTSGAVPSFLLDTNIGSGFVL